MTTPRERLTAAIERLDGAFHPATDFFDYIEPGPEHTSTFTEAEAKQLNDDLDMFIDLIDDEDYDAAVTLGFWEVIRLRALREPSPASGEQAAT